jgi:hypothetical protein
MATTGNVNRRGEAMRAASSLSNKRAMRQDQLRESSLRVAAGRRPRVKSVPIFDVGGTSIKSLF